jgi:uncharacterized protein (DUF1330 family)
MSNYTWTAWTIKIGPKAYKGIQPLSIEIRPAVTLHSSGYLWWKKEWTERTGKWEIKFTYETGPLTPRRTDIIEFASEDQAQYWYDNTYNTVFLSNLDKVVPPPAMPPPPKMKLPETKKPNKPGLKLV